MSLLQVEALTRRFGGLCAVDGVSFAVEAGGITAVIGPNGAEKTTLFSMIAGALPPSAGRVRLDGVALTGLPPHRVAAHGLVRSFQLVRLFGTMSVEENVLVGCHMGLRGGVLSALLRPPSLRRAEQAARADARALLTLVGLEHRAGVSASALTYGEQRLLEVARALAAQPRLLLLDEPAAGLAVTETAALAQTLRAIVARGVTVLLIEHDMSLVMDVAQHVVVLDFGRKIADGTPDAVARDPVVIDAYLGAEATSDLVDA